MSLAANWLGLVWTSAAATKFWGREDRYRTYVCKYCERETGEGMLVLAPMAPAVISASFVSPSAIAHLTVQKYVMYVLWYHLKQEFERQGLKMTRQPMSKCLLKATED